jgi:hypothetical protein
MRARPLVALGLALAARDLAAQSPTPAAPAQIVHAARLRTLADSLAPAASRTAQLGRGERITYLVLKVAAPADTGARR